MLQKLSQKLEGKKEKSQTNFEKLLQFLEIDNAKAQDSTLYYLNDSLLYIATGGDPIMMRQAKSFGDYGGYHCEVFWPAKRLKDVYEPVKI